jgi:hypothetical protein
MVKLFLFKQKKDKKNESNIINFAEKFTVFCHTLGMYRIIITELTDEGVLFIEGDLLSQKKNGKGRKH